MSAALRKIIREQREEIKRLKARIKELEDPWCYCDNDMEGMGMMIGSAMKEDLAEERRLEGWD